MSHPSPETAADPEALVAALPDPPAPWQRSDANGGIVEYRIPDDDGVCAAAKLVVRPELFDDSAVRVDRKQGCKDVGTGRHPDIESAVDAVTTEIAAAVGD
ncbi:hypothetical protein SAMN05443574_105101 [Haloarcula vallismortis]|uniref:Uncharacterized protein n=1 Tax=Haloarcula vallismortis TaxID=28442 RepID=A0A1H2V387_HALVA|nr:hypothetical protein [Haloarcula vallismortis]SDW62745.1 hypothetical protein SAMN05443574_105101 [Haloarcula vallismortis]